MRATCSRRGVGDVVGVVVGVAVVVVAIVAGTAVGGVRATSLSSSASSLSLSSLSSSLSSSSSPWPAPFTPEQWSAGNDCVDAMLTVVTQTQGNSSLLPPNSRLQWSTDILNLNAAVQDVATALLALISGATLQASEAQVRTLVADNAAASKGCAALLAAYSSALPASFTGGMHAFNASTTAFSRWIVATFPPLSNTSTTLSDADVDDVERTPSLIHVRRRRRPSSSSSNRTVVGGNGPPQAIAQAQTLIDEVMWQLGGGLHVDIVAWPNDSGYFLKSSPKLTPGNLFKAPRAREYDTFANPQLYNTTFGAAPTPSMYAIIAHELFHTTDYLAMNAVELAAFALRYEFNYTFHCAYEHATDRAVLERAVAMRAVNASWATTLADGLIAYREWIYAKLTPAQLAAKRREYMTPEEIRAWLADHP